MVMAARPFVAENTRTMVSSSHASPVICSESLPTGRPPARRAGRCSRPPPARAGGRSCRQRPRAPSEAGSRKPVDGDIGRRSSAGSATLLVSMPVQFEVSRIRNSAMASATTQSTKAPMLMRSQTPIHGVGRFAAIRGASTPVKAPTRPGPPGSRGSRGGTAFECGGPESYRQQHEENSHHRKDDVHGVGQVKVGSPAGRRRPGEADDSVGDQQTATIRSGRFRGSDARTPHPKAATSTV